LTSGTVQTTVGAVVAGAVVAEAVVGAVVVTAVAVAGAGATEPDVTTGTGITLGFGTMITGSTGFLGWGGGRVRPLGIEPSAFRTITLVLSGTRS
jgi:hypothetical protein